MNTVPTLLLGLGLLLAETPDADPARLREMLYDRQQPRGQSQAALLLVQARTPEADAIIRQGLCQTETPEQFQALAGALRMLPPSTFSISTSSASSSPYAVKVESETVSRAASTLVSSGVAAATAPAKSAACSPTGSPCKNP